jgi:hypothetical protein
MSLGACSYLCGCGSLHVQEGFNMGELASRHFLKHLSLNNDFCAWSSLSSLFGVFGVCLGPNFDPNG